MATQHTSAIRTGPIIIYWACAMFSRDGVEEMMRNAMCFIILFRVKICYSIPNMQVGQTPYLCSRGSLIRAPKYPTLHTNAHKTINSIAPKSDHEWCEQHLSNQSLHPFQATTFTISHFVQTQEAFYP